MTSERLLKISQVDDDRDFLKLINVLLEPSGHKVFLPQAGTNAAIEIPTIQPGCIVT